MALVSTVLSVLFLSSSFFNTNIEARHFIIGDPEKFDPVAFMQRVADEAVSIEFFP